MCDPVSITAGASLGIGIISDEVKARAEHDRAEKARESANASAVAQIKQLNTRQSQEEDAANLSIMQADRQARIADATARVAAGESGVAGASVDALLTDIQRQDAEFKSITNRNLSNTKDQIAAEKQGVFAEKQSRINANPFPSALATGINIAGRGFDYATQYLIRQPKP